MSVWIVALVLHSILLTPSPPFRHSSAGISLINPHLSTSARIGAPLFHATLLTPPPLLVLLQYYGSFSITVGTPQPRSGAVHFHSMLPQHLPCTPLFRSVLRIWHSSVPGCSSPFSSNHIVLPVKPPC